VIYTCTFVYIYIHAYVYTCVYVYIYIHVMLQIVALSGNPVAMKKVSI